MLHELFGFRVHFIVSGFLAEANFYFTKQLWCCVSGRVKHGKLVLSNEVIKKGLES